MAHDASATWSGFNYQGKVALFHTLKLIIEKLGNGDSLTDYQLILENNEDFDIQGPGGYISFHQVKAINETAYNKFQDALIAMLLQLDLPTFNSVNGYIHTWHHLNWQGNRTFPEQLQTTIEKLINDQVTNPGNCTITKSLNTSTNVSKAVKIIRQAIQSDARMNDFSSVETVLQGIVDDNRPNAAINRVKRYDYGNNSLSCSIERIDGLVKQKIEELQLIANIAIDDTATDKVYCHLLRLLDENVIAKHSDLTNSNLNPINISQLFEIVTDETIRDSDDAYLASQFKLVFVSTFEQFLEDDELCPVDIAEEYSNGTSKLNRAMGILLTLPATELWNYYKNFSPQIAFEDNNVIGQAFYTEVANIRNFLFLIFSQLCHTKLKHLKDKQKFKYSVGSESYLPTTIGNIKKRQIVKDLMRSPQAIVTLFEISTLVSGDDRAPTINNFAKEYSNQAHVDIEEFYSNQAVEDKEKISQISKSIRLINMDTAIQEVNDD
jgi:hypothetical protein